MPKTLDCFSDDPGSAPVNMMELLAMSGARLTPAQQAFKRLAEEIEVTEARLQELGGLLDAFRPLFANKLDPLQDERDAINREMVLFLDEKLARKGYSAIQRQTMRHVLLQIVEMSFGSAYNDEMMTLFDRHSDVTLAERAATEKRNFAEDIGQALGVELDADALDGRSTEDLLQEALRQLEREDQARAEAADARAAARRGGRKSARALQAEQQAVDAGKLLKEIYRKLTSTLHPDREPDAGERARKTALMSEVNKAYSERNILKLLQLQWQAVKVDSRAAAGMANEKLRVINQTLRRQQQELKMESRELEALIRDEFRLKGFGPLSAPALQKALNAQAANARAKNRNMRLDLAELKRNEVAFKDWLKVEREFAREEAQLEEVILTELMRAKPGRRR